MAFGRPTEYDAIKHPRGVVDYIRLCNVKSYLPTVEGLAVHLSVARSSIYLWAEKREEPCTIAYEI